MATMNNPHSWAREIADEVRRVTAERHRRPEVTYRLQFHRDETDVPPGG